HVEAKLSALAHRTEKQREADKSRRVHVTRGTELRSPGFRQDGSDGYSFTHRPNLDSLEKVSFARFDASPVQGAYVVGKEAHSHEQAKITNTIGDEGLLAGRSIRLFGKPKTDEQVTAEAHAFPTDKKNGEAIAEHQNQHRKHEEVQVGKEAR